MVWVTVIFAAGIVFNEYVRLPFAVLVVSAGFSMGAGLLIIHRPFVGTAVLLTSFFFLGAVISRNYQTPDKDDISYVAGLFYKDPVIIRGVIVSDVERQKFSKTRKFVFKLKACGFKASGAWEKKGGLLLVNLFRDEKIAYGDHV